MLCCSLMSVRPSLKTGRSTAATTSTCSSQKWRSMRASSSWLPTGAVLQCLLMFYGDDQILMTVHVYKPELPRGAMAFSLSLSRLSFHLQYMHVAHSVAEASACAPSAHDIVQLVSQILTDLLPNLILDATHHCRGLMPVYHVIGDTHSLAALHII